MLKSFITIFFIAGALMLGQNSWAAEIQMGGKTFQGKVTVRQDGTVTTESTAKEVDVEEGGKKRLKLDYVDGKLTVVDPTGEEMVIEQGGKFKSKRARSGTPSTTGSSGTTAGSTSTTSSSQTQQQTTTTGQLTITQTTIANEQNGILAAGLPMMVNVEVDATDAIAGPFDVKLKATRSGGSAQTFNEKIEQLEKGKKSFAWDLLKEPKAGKYTISVEISNSSLKLKQKSQTKVEVLVP